MTAPRIMKAALLMEVGKISVEQVPVPAVEEGCVHADQFLEHQAGAAWAMETGKLSVWRSSRTATRSGARQDAARRKLFHGINGVNSVRLR